MTLATEPIGSLPRKQGGTVADNLAELEKLGCPVLVDGEEGRTNSVAYPLTGLAGVAASGVTIPYADGHLREFPKLTAGPFRYGGRAGSFVREAREHTSLPVKATVVSPSHLSLLYPADGIDGYSREQFLSDVADEAEADIRSCLDAGAHRVQLDCGLHRLTAKLDPSGGLLDDFVALDNRVLERFTEDERARIGVHTYPGADQGSTHSLDVDYAELLPKFFRLKAGNFYVQLASEPDPDRVLALVADHLPPSARVFVGVTDPLDQRVETPEQVRDRILAAARHLPADRLGTCDDAGFAAYADDTFLSRETAFAKIEARVKGTELAAKDLGL
ncbi:5-methyltetrahydropteroyltriglutamate--homocysteine methyltransferase [Streptomyces sp. NPDC004327]|uniref:5-methyltetrahydropteroyltriglutamate-- homocysteine methyltransferase n=1 Tax=Streptomyces sp. NPDC004327 TaxID=3364699 RepID=UPI003682277A